MSHNAGQNPCDFHGIAKRWKEMQGSQNWENLLDPLDADLRRHILIYGDQAESTYDAFIHDRHSKYAGFCRYSTRSFFQDLGLTRSYQNKWPYALSRHLYATSTADVPLAFILTSLSREAWDKESNWMGYVAFTTDDVTLGRRDVTVAWRGTVQSLEWVDDFELGDDPLTPLLPPPDVKVVDEATDRVARTEARVYRGWMDIYTSDDPRSAFNKTSARQQVTAEVRRLVEAFRSDRNAGRLSVTLTGHSLGGALATLCAFDVAVNVVPGGDVPVTAVVFGCPKVGNDAFKKVVERVPGLRVLRVENANDVVPLYPCLGFEHVGQVLQVDSTQSTYVKGDGDLSCWHNLEGYLHAVAGTRGRNDAFELQVDRDVALVNKYLDWLKDDALVPASWWVERNKGMSQGPGGHWSLREPPPPTQ